MCGGSAIHRGGGEGRETVYRGHDSDAEHLYTLSKQNIESHRMLMFYTSIAYQTILYHGFDTAAVKMFPLI